MRGLGLECFGGLRAPLAFKASPLQDGCETSMTAGHDRDLASKTRHTEAASKNPATTSDTPTGALIR